MATTKQCCGELDGQVSRCKLYPHKAGSTTAPHNITSLVKLKVTKTKGVAEFLAPAVYYTRKTCPGWVASMCEAGRSEIALTMVQRWGIKLGSISSGAVIKNAMQITVLVPCSPRLSNRSRQIMLHRIAQSPATGLPQSVHDDSNNHAVGCLPPDSHSHHIAILKQSSYWLAGCCCCKVYER